MSEYIKQIGRDSVKYRTAIAELRAMKFVNDNKAFCLDQAVDKYTIIFYNSGE